jgi:hypothetical protein
MDTSSAAEQAFAMRAAIASKSIQEWLEELTAWSWPNSGFESPPAKRRKLSYDETNGPSGDSGLNSKEYLGGLLSSEVTQYERRVHEISQAMEDLDVEEIKKHVLHSHILPLSRPGTPLLELSRPPSMAAAIAFMDDFTALITATIIQALPNLSKLTRLLRIWSVRLVVLRKSSVFLTELDDARVALKSGWNAMDLGAKAAPGDTLLSPSVLSRKDFDVMKSILERKVTAAGQSLDHMLDALEGHEDTLPDSWIDHMDSVEREYGEWVAACERKIRAAEFARQSHPTTPAKVTHDAEPVENGQHLDHDQSPVNTHMQTSTADVPEPEVVIAAAVAASQPIHHENTPEPVPEESTSTEVLTAVDEEPEDVQETPKSKEITATHVPETQHPVQTPVPDALEDSIPADGTDVPMDHQDSIHTSANELPKLEEIAAAAVTASLANHQDDVQKSVPETLKLEDGNSSEVTTTPKNHQDIVQKSVHAVPEVGEATTTAAVAPTPRDLHDGVQSSTVDVPKSEATTAVAGITDSPVEQQDAAQVSVPEGAKSKAVTLPADVTDAPMKHPDAIEKASHEVSESKMIASAVTITPTNGHDIQTSDPEATVTVAGTTTEHGSDIQKSTLEATKSKEITPSTVTDTMTKNHDVQVAKPELKTTTKAAITSKLGSIDVKKRIQELNKLERKSSSSAVTGTPVDRLSETQKSILQTPRSKDISTDRVDGKNQSSKPGQRASEIDKVAHTLERSTMSEVSHENHEKSESSEMRGFDGNEDVELPMSTDSSASTGQDKVGESSFSSAEDDLESELDRNAGPDVPEPELPTLPRARRSSETSEASTIVHSQNMEAMEFSSELPDHGTPEFPIMQSIERDPSPSDDISPPSSPLGSRFNTRSPSVSFNDIPTVVEVPFEETPPKKATDSLAVDDEEDSKREIGNSRSPSRLSMSSVDVYLQKQISDILESIPGKIRLTSQPPEINLNPPDFKVPTARIRPRPDPLGRSHSSLSSRAATPTPSFTLAPARNPRSRQQRSGNQEIKLYQLSRSNGEAPIKLFIRCVGENGERVMVRVGGGWADLGEYLKEYVSHHHRRSGGEGKVEVTDLPARGASALGQRSSPPSRPTSALDMAAGGSSPVSPLHVRKTRRGTATTTDQQPRTPAVQQPGCLGDTDLGDVRPFALQLSS